jgi:hypothetical protein
MSRRIRTSVLIALSVAGWLALVPAAAEAQRGRAIALAAANNYLNGGVYGGYLGGYGYPRYYGGYTTAYGNGNYGGGFYGGYPVYGNAYGGYPVYGYNNGGYGYGYRGGYPAFGNAAAYGLGGLPRRTYFDR